MPLVINLGITTEDGVAAIETLRVSRLTRLRGGDPRDQVHAYRAVRLSAEGEEQASGQFRHRYGDGAWICTMRALMSLTLRSNDLAARVPLREVDLAGLIIEDDEETA